MSYLTGNIYSAALNMETNIGVILPHDSKMHRGIKPFPNSKKASSHPKTLILLHGLTDNVTSWIIKSRVYAYAQENDVAVIIPEVGRSFYQDMKYGQHFFKYITKELPVLAGEMFGISVDPNSLMIAGLSMGGYAALKCGFTYPENYRAIGAFSSVYDIEKFIKFPALSSVAEGLDRDAKAMFGEDMIIPDEANIEYLIRNADKSKIPPIFMTCGEQDELLIENNALHKLLVESGISVEYKTWQGGHEWPFWDVSVKNLLDKYA